MVRPPGKRNIALLSCSLCATDNSVETFINKQKINTVCDVCFSADITLEQLFSYNVVYVYVLLSAP